MSSRTGAQSEQQQFDMDSLFDFSQGTSQQSPITGQPSPFGREERQQFNGPSHDYGQFKQQVGVPLAHMAGMPQAQMNPSAMDGFNSGFGEMDFNSGYGFNSGLDFDADMTMDFVAPQNVAPMFFPNVTANAATDAQADFVNPTKLIGQDEPASNVGRLWPGMHSQQAQQAALAKAAQTQAAQQRQIKLQNQQAQLRQASKVAPTPSSQASSQQQQQTLPNTKRASHAVDPVVEESISRLLNQMRQNGSSSADNDDADFLPNIARLKKDEEDMDEDERLLASEEGKKLSSKERRQLRNKVSARAFRSRRKEYITQLEGEVALRTQENNALRAENQSVMAENERYRHLIETLLQHPAYRPFINDISNDPSLLGVPRQHIQQQPQQPQSQPSVTPTSQPSQSSQASQQQDQQQQQPQQDMKPEYLNFDASQLQIPTPQPGDQAPHVNMATMPETDFSKLNINGFKNVQGVDFNNYSVGAYAVTGIPPGPCPLESLMHAPVRLPRCLVSDDVPATACDAAPDADLTVLLAKLDRAAQRLDAARPLSSA